jgi:hypothetical protein
MKKFLIKIDKFLDSHTTLWFFLILLVILRVPNFFEPYWYGDEGIYLTVGQSIRSGQQLYSEIIDHKTPIIYYLATVPNQFYFRVLLLFWMIISTAFFYSLSRKFFKNKYLTWLSLLIFVIFTTLPWFEGNIPNGELFVLGFVLAGLWLLSKSEYLDKVINKKKTEKTKVKANKSLIFAGGAFFGLAILTKVPALLDLAAIMLIPWFAVTGKLLQTSRIDLNKKIAMFKSLFNRWLPLLAGVGMMIILSIVYFTGLSSGADYLEYGLLYNLHYTQSWQVNFASQLINFLFTLQGKTLVLALILVALTLFKNLSLKLKFFLGWTSLAMYAVLLSNRPYAHYFIQAILPLSFLLTTMTEDLIAGFKNKKLLKQTLWSLALGATIIAGSALILISLDFRLYPTKKYYVNYFKFIKGELTQEEYFSKFNWLMSDNYQLTEFIQNTNEKRLFIWGTNPMLYALSETIPVGRYTVSFHITDMNAYEETLQAVTQAEPKFIVVMNNAPSFPEFYNYLEANYSPNYNYDHMTLYKRENPGN